ncbi:protein NATD1-like [Trichomycterus rosablanca]|uniref:protein NATD1-like n=1 Tax=Trichomycterus rosablanca TaxID=2290929 RepID=UPI002F358F93
MWLHRNSVCTGAQILKKIKFNTFPCCVLSTEADRVIHERRKQRFTVRLNSEEAVESAVLKYSYMNDKHVHLLSTEVPERFRGKGVAASLAKAALDFVVKENLKATISCWYIKKYVDENPHQRYDAHIED